MHARFASRCATVLASESPRVTASWLRCRPARCIGGGASRQNIAPPLPSSVSSYFTADGDVPTVDDELLERRQAGHVGPLVQWYPGHIARAERQLKEQLRLVDVVLDVRDARIPLSTGHPSVASWTGGKLRLVVLNQMDRVSDTERARWTAYFQTAANTRVVFTNARTGDGVQRLARLALSVSEGVNQRRAEKGLRPRPVRAAVVGFPNVGKSALINRLLGRAQCASAQRPGVTRHLQWVSLGPEGSLMLLDAPGVLPMRLADQHAAIRLAICNDIGEASYTTSLVAAQFVELLRKHPTQGRQRMASLEQRYRISAAGLTGEDYILAMAEKHCGGEVERAGRKLLKDYQEGKLGTFGLDVVPPYESSGGERDAHRAPPPPQQQQVGTVWQPDGPSRRVVKEAEKAARRGDVMPSSL